jgi:DNA modification methylase
MKILKGKFGECRFIDNMNPDYGLPSLKDKSWDLCLTDYPFNVSFKGKAFGGQKYDDSKSFEEYLDFCKTTFAEIQRVSKGQIIFCGNPNINMWIKYIAEPKDIGIHYAGNKESRGKGFMLAKHDFFLLYGDTLLGKSLFNQNLEYQNMPNHPCPNNPKLYKSLIKSSKKTTCLDLFLGSGTTAQCCEEMGIPWLGYEIMEAYAPDIEKRIALGMKSHDSYMKSKKKQLTLF